MLPISESLLLPAVAKNVTQEIELKCQKAKLYYDKGAKPMPDLQIGRLVRLQPLATGDTWKAATTVSKLGDHSYLLQTDQGQLYRRNRKFIRLTPTVPATATPELYEDYNSNCESIPEPMVTTEKLAQPQEDTKQEPSTEQETMGTPTDLNCSSPTVTSKGRTVRLPARL